MKFNDLVAIGQNIEHSLAACVSHDSVEYLPGLDEAIQLFERLAALTLRYVNKDIIFSCHDACSP
jgi:hypothetical protein